MPKINSVKDLKKGQEVWRIVKNDRQLLRVIEIDNFDDGDYQYSEVTCEHLYYESIGKRSSYAETMLTQKDIASGRVFTT